MAGKEKRDVGRIKQLFLQKQGRLPRAAEGTELQSVGTNCEFTSLCMLLNQSCTLTDGCLFFPLMLFPFLRLSSLPLFCH